MSDATMADAARALIDGSRYMTIATADAEGRPWVSPVWFAHKDYAEFLWVSRPDARHSLNIEVRPSVALVVFDSTVAPQNPGAVFIEAEVEEVDAEALDRAVGRLLGQIGRFRPKRVECGRCQRHRSSSPLPGAGGCLVCSRGERPSRPNIAFNEESLSETPLMSVRAHDGKESS